MSLKQWKFTNGYEPYETLPSVSSDDNGKVLGVSEGQYALVSGGGGGSVEPLIVELTYDSGTGTTVANKTCSEIYEAYMNGTPVIATITDNIEGALSSHGGTIVSCVKGTNPQGVNVSYNFCLKLNFREWVLVKADAFLSVDDEYPTLEDFNP